jgi:2-oxoglutarate dehydrogenase E1 component
MKRDFRKPLILMTPKSLLRSERAVSYLDDFTSSSFQQILGPTLFDKPSKVTRVIFSAGKVYYDLLKQAEASKAKDVALIRIEQLYPLNAERIEEIIEPLGKAEKWVWCQEEPKNMGAWTYISPLLNALTPRPIQYAGRPPAASTAVGSKAWHDRQQRELVEHAFSI